MYTFKGGLLRVGFYLLGFYGSGLLWLGFYSLGFYG